MINKTLLYAALLSTTLTQPVWAQSDQPVTADGKAQIVGKNPDRNAIMNAALEDARAKIVRQLLADAIGNTQVNKVTAEQLDFLKQQISPSAIRVEGIPRVVNGELIVSVSANIDRNSFREKISKAEIETSSDLADEAAATVVMMIDFSEGASEDVNSPSQVVTDYNSSKGASYSDQSVSASSEKSKEASSDRSAQGSSVRGSAAAAASGYYGSAAARSGYSGSAASMSRSASASAYSNSQVQKNDVQAEVHDDVNFHQVVASRDSTPVFKDEQVAITAIAQVAQNYGIGFTPINRFSSQYFGGRAPKWAILKDDFRFSRFLDGLNSQNVNFFASGTLNIVQLGATESGNFYRCTGSLNVQIIPTKGMGNLPAARADDSGSGISPENCRGKLITTLSVKVGEQLGSKIQDYWRRASTKAAKADAIKEQQKYALTEAGADYTLSFSAGAGLDYMAARQIGQLLPTIPGVDKVARQSLTDKQVVYLVHYQGKEEVDGLIMDKLTSVQALANFRPAKVNGTSLDFCSGSCN